MAGTWGQPWPKWPQQGIPKRPSQPVPRHSPGYPGPNHGGGTGGTPTPPPTFTQDQQTAFDVMSNLLSQYGLGSLAGTLKSIILSGVTDQTEISLQLQQTDAWKQRFAGNEMLRQKGLPVLSVSEYLATEQSYAQVMKNYGLPAGFYDDHNDFAKFIGNSVSANELQQRVQMYADVANREDPSVLKQLQSMGTTKGDLLAYMVDPQRAMPLIQQKYTSTLIGAAARRAGLTPDNNYVQHLAELGVSEQAASQGYGQAAAELPGASLLGSIYHEDITQGDLLKGIFDNDATAQAKTKQLASQERAAFSGSGGTNQGSLARSDGGLY